MLSDMYDYFVMSKLKLQELKKGIRNLKGREVFDFRMIEDIGKF